jgi:hypothetical protein
MPSPVRLLIAIAIASALLLLASSQALAAGPIWGDGTGTVAGEATSDPQVGSISGSVSESSRANGQGGSSNTPAVTCQWLIAEEAAVSQARAMTTVQTVRFRPDGSQEHLYGHVCSGAITEWRWIRVTSVADLVGQAAAQVRRLLPKPSGVFTPPADAGVVHVPVSFSVPAAQWAPVSATATAAGASVTVTARPTGLVFTSGDGGGSTSCPGPGSTAASASSCSYTYANASSVAPGGRAWPGTLGIRWTVGWTASDGETGALDPMTTTSAVAMTVREIESVERAGQ